MGCTAATITNEEDHDRYYHNFKAMIELSEYLLVGMNSEIFKAPLCNFVSYTVIPLFLTVLKCRDPLIAAIQISKKLGRL